MHLAMDLLSKKVSQFKSTMWSTTYQQCQSITEWWQGSPDWIEIQNKRREAKLGQNFPESARPA